jgi:hypothetical protein
MCRYNEPGPLAMFCLSYGLQINTMMANATIAGSNIYAANWTGPPSSTYRLDAMSGAIAALVAAIGPAPASTPSPAVSAQSGQTSSTMTSGQSSQTSLPFPSMFGCLTLGLRTKVPAAHRHSLARGATIGIGFAAAIVALLLGCAALLFCYRRRRQAQAVSSAPYENVTRFPLFFCGGKTLIVSYPEWIWHPCRRGQARGPGCALPGLPDPRVRGLG